MDCDLLVVGGGAAGLSGAVTAAYHGLTVIVAEKAPVLGGATSWSGGWMWAPLNPLSQADGIVEDIDEPRTYLKHALGENYDEPRIEALLENARHMVAFFEQHTALQFVSGTWIADIQGDLPGAGTGGRSVGPKPINLRRISKELRPKLRRQLYETSFLGLGIMAGPDLQAFLHATTSVRGFLHAGWRVAFHVLDLITHRQGMQLVNGTALIARLAKSADDLGVRLLTNTPASRLLTENGAVTGAVLSAPDGEITVRARRGVLLAAGGFPNDVARRRELFPRTPTGKEHWTLAPPETTGDGVTLGESVGGRFDTALASPAAWCPVSLVPYRSGRVGTYPHIVDRGKPGLIAVLANGRRFVNEADGYYQFTTGMIAAVPDGEEVAAWLICDHAFQRRYPFGMSKPFPVPVWPYVRSGYLTKGTTLRDLARRCGIDPTALEQTVARFNEHARVGEDPEFHRGVSAFNKGSGDKEHGPNPSLAPLEKGPFYAIKVLPGSFGTFAGLSTDPSSRVLDAAGQPVPGLYAAGSDQANVMGGHYPSGGINIGPAMTFGYIAGRHAAGVAPLGVIGWPATLVGPAEILGSMTPTFERSFWEERWSQVLREHADQVAHRPPNSHLTGEVEALRPGVALDAGCGHGSDTLWLAARGWRVTAVDFSATALAHARSTAEAVGADVAVDPVTGAATAAVGQVQVSVEAAVAALDPGGWEFLVAADRPRAVAGTGVDAVIYARRRGPGSAR